MRTNEGQSLSFSLVWLVLGICGWLDSAHRKAGMLSSWKSSKGFSLSNHLKNDFLKLGPLHSGVQKIYRLQVSNYETLYHKCSNKTFWEEFFEDLGANVYQRRKENKPIKCYWGSSLFYVNLIYKSTLLVTQTMNMQK